MTGAVEVSSTAHPNAAYQPPEAPEPLGEAADSVDFKRTPEEVLLHILDPNREVSPSYVEYVVALTDGRVVRGVIAAETPASLTLRRAEGASDTILRQNIEEMSNIGLSLMPEGLEKNIPPQDMADLLRFLLEKK